MDPSITEDTMDVVFDKIADQGLMDSGLLLLLRSMLGLRNASEICNLTQEQIRMELWLRTDDEIGDFTTEEAARLLRNAIDTIQKGLPESSEPCDEPVETPSRIDEDFARDQLVNGSSFADYDTISSDIKLNGQNVGRANSVSGDIVIKNGIVRFAHSTSGDIKLNDVILLSSCATVSGDIKGNFYLAPNATARTTSGDIKAKYKKLSWGELYEIAVGFRFIEPGHARLKTIGDLRPQPGAATETVIITQTHKHVDYFMLNDEFVVCNSCGVANHIDEFNRKNGCPNCGK